MKTNNFSSISYDNEFRWAYIWQVLLYAIVVVLGATGLTLPITVFIMDFSTALDRFAFIVSAVVISIIFLSVVAIVYFPRVCVGKYHIVGDNLIVNEKYLSSNVNLTIPISCITEVQRTPYITSWSRFWREKNTGLIVPFRLLEITVGDQKYLLYCVTHAEELYAELSKRINNYKTNN